MTTDLHELSGAYVLDAVDDIERAAFARHLAECEACTAEVAELREVADLLGELAEQPPPPALRANVLAAARQTPQDGWDFPPPARPVLSSRTKRAGRARPTWLVAAVAAAAAAVLAVTGTAVVMDQVNGRHLRDLDRQVQAMQGEQARIYAIMRAKDAVMIGSSLPDRGGRVAAALSTIEQGGVAMFAGLKLPPPGEVYQLWLNTGQKVVSGLVVPAGLTGGTMLFEHWIPDVARVDITYEPMGGSTSPTMKPLAFINME
jgi:Anti-sigma-K factor rskA, C-terminal/Putative zinc-finger